MVGCGGTRRRRVVEEEEEEEEAGPVGREGVAVGWRWWWVALALVLLRPLWLLLPLRR